MTDALSDPELRRRATIADLCGLRQSAKLTLARADVEFERRYIRNRRCFPRTSRSYELTEVNSGSGTRVVTVNDAAAQAVRADQQSQREATLAVVGNSHLALSGLCLAPTGRSPEWPTVTHSFTSMLAKAGRAPMRWPNLLAVCGALLFQAGTDISVVSKMLGHQVVGVTSRYYHGVAEPSDGSSVTALARCCAVPRYQPTDAPLRRGSNRSDPGQGILTT